MLSAESFIEIRSKLHTKFELRTKNASTEIIYELGMNMANISSIVLLNKVDFLNES